MKFNCEKYFQFNSFLKCLRNKNIWFHAKASGGGTSSPSVAITKFLNSVRTKMKYKHFTHEEDI